MFDQEMERTIQEAFESARDRNHEYVTIEHLMLALTRNPDAGRALSACGADLEAVREHLRRHIERHTPALPPQAREGAQPSVALQRVLRRAIVHAQSTTDEEVGGANVLVAIFAEPRSQAARILESQDVHRIDIVNYLAHGIVRTENWSEELAEGEGEEGDAAPANFVENLNEKARRGDIDPLIGRDDELRRAIQVLCRRRKNNPLFVGDAGVGKTALAEGLALRVVEGDAPAVMRDAVVYALDMGAVLAGTRYRGDFEKRFKDLIGALGEDQNAILFIDEIHTLIGAGSAMGSAMDASDMIKPLLSSGRLRCIGATTYREFRGIFEKDRALARRFQKIDIVEPTPAESYKILLGLRSRFEAFHNVRYPNKALRAAAELSARHMQGRALPDKAIDVIDETGAALRIARPDAERARGVRVADIERTISLMARIPPRSLAADDAANLSALERNLKTVIFGQDHAIERVVASIKLSRSGLGERDRPVGGFLFAGPTGVGKTELAKQLARFGGMPLIRFDMSEYMERHTVSRLIGAPPGYVGYDQGGLLTDAILEQSHAVLLLDEIEKAHPDVFNLLLQVMDRGALTDANGRRADFRNVTLIMTTNAGAQEMERGAPGFVAQPPGDRSAAEIKRIFSPEFRNRLDAVVTFNALEPEVVLTIVDKFLAEAEALLEEKKVRLTVDDAVRGWLAEHGCEPGMGARPMRRLVMERIKKPLVDELLFGALKGGGRARFRLGKDGPRCAVAAPAATTSKITPASKTRQATGARKAPGKASARGR